MSWQAYIDEQLMVPLRGGGALTAAAILGEDGGVWAASPAFPEVSDAEVAAVMRGFADVGSLAAAGLRLGGVKYMVVAGEPGEVIRGKKGAGGAVVKKTATALVVGLYDEGAAPGDVNVAVEGLGDYLKEQGI